MWQRNLSTHGLNLGFGFDRTQNVLWRLDQGELDGQTPDIAVVMIGTNNLAEGGSVHASTPAETVEGILAIGGRLHRQASRVIVMAILPRSTSDDPLRARIIDANRLLANHSVTRP